MHFSGSFCRSRRWSNCFRAFLCLLQQVGWDVWCQVCRSTAVSKTQTISIKPQEKDRKWNQILGARLMDIRSGIALKSLQRKDKDVGDKCSSQPYRQNIFQLVARYYRIYPAKISKCSNSWRQCLWKFCLRRVQTLLSNKNFTEIRVYASVCEHIFRRKIIQSNRCSFGMGPRIKINYRQSICCQLLDVWL